MFTVKCDNHSKPLEKQLEVRKRREVFGNDLHVEVSVFSFSFKRLGDATKIPVKRFGHKESRHHHHYIQQMSHLM